MSLASPYDALLFLSFGGPEGPDDVVPFLENVTRGRGIPRERLVEVGAHYFKFGGVSPINGQCRALIATLERDFAGNGLADLPVYWGNRNWEPYVADTVGRMAADGVRRALVFVTSAYSSYSGCRQYREDLAAAVSAAGAEGIELDKIRAYYDHPGFVGPNTEAALRALDSLDPAVRDGAELVFVTHSLPLSLAETSDYVAQHEEVARLVAEGVEKATGVIGRPRALVYCSRSGPPTQPWLEPDVSDHLRERRTAGTEAVVVLPVGFISDHMEVVYDLDTEAAETAEEIGLAFARAATVGVAPAFVEAIRDLVLERAARERGETVQRKTLGSLGPMPDICAAGCCSNPRGNRPALCGRD